MPTRLIQIVAFVNVAPAATLALPHNININDVPKKPDFVATDAAGFTVVVTATQVSVTNTNAGPASVNVWLELKHTIPRELGNKIANLTPQPFIAATGGSGGGGPVTGDPNTQAYFGPLNALTDDLFATMTLTDWQLNTNGTAGLPGQAVHVDRANRSVAIGENSQALGVDSVAIGNGSTANGANSLAVGQGSGTNAAPNSAAIGQGCQTNAAGAFAHGFGSQANGANSQAGGQNAVANGAASHAEGFLTTAGGAQAHAEGSQSTASGAISHAEGDRTVASGPASHAEGIQTNATADHAHAEGQTTTASGINSHAEGQGSTASGAQAHAEGNSNQARGDNSHCEGSGTQTLLVADSAHAEGSGTTAGNTAAHAEGLNTTASAQYAHAEGQVTTASGTAAHAEGVNSVASGNVSHAEGDQCTASGGGSHAQGARAVASRTGQDAMASYAFAADGDAQTSVLVFRGQVPDGSFQDVELTYGFAEQFILEDGKTYTVKYTVAAGGTQAGPVRVSRGFEGSFNVRRDGGVSVITNTGVGQSYGDAATNDWAFNATIGAAPDRIVFDFVTGAVATTGARAVARVEFTEVTY